MRIAFSKPAAPAELDHLMNDFREEGYDGLQLKTGQFLPYLDDPDAFIAKYSQQGVASTLVYYDELDDERLDAVIEFAAAVGTEVVVFCHNRTRDSLADGERIAIAQQLATHAAKARARGLGFSLHHHFDQPVMLPEDVREFWGAIDPGLIGLTVDTAHLAKSGVTDIPAFLAEFAPIVDNIHLKDYADGEWRLLGQGDLDLEAILRQLAADGFDGWLCVDEESSASLDEGFRISRAWLDQHLPAPAA
jgi:sugar phosphate isomerase/epimerase